MRGSLVSSYLIFCAFWIWMSVSFPKFGNFQPLFLWISFLLLFFSLSSLSGTSQLCKQVHLMLSHTSFQVSLLSFILFYFYSSYWMNSTALFLKSLILSSDWSSLLLSPSVKYLVIVFFSSVIPAWTFQCFLSFCWNSYFAHSFLSWPQWASLRQLFWTFY